MKKLTVILLCIAVIVGIGSGIGVFLKTKKSKIRIESILPQNVSLYVQFQDVEKNFEELISMPIWRGISNIDFDGLMRKNGWDGQQGMLLSLITNQLSDIVSNPVAKSLFGNEVAFAIYPFDEDFTLLTNDLKAFDPKVAEKLLSGLFLVTRVDKDVQFAEFVSRFFKQFGSNVSQGQVEYKGQIIRTINITSIGIKFGMVRLGDLLVIGIGDKAARISVDVYKRDKPSLAKDPQFAKIYDRSLKPSSMTGYFNLVKLVKEFKVQGEKLISMSENASGNIKLQAQWEKALAKMTGLKVFALSSQLTPIIRVDSRLAFDPGALDFEYASLYTCPPSENKTIRFTPKGVLGYHWSNCFKLDYYWKQIIKEMESAEVPTSKIDDFEAKIGLSVEKDILPAFGEEIGGYIQNIQVGGMFPIPKILFFIEIRNKSKAEDLLKKLENQPFMMFQDENYNGTLIKYIALPLGQEIQPGYAFLGDYLLISTSRKLIKDSIDASGSTSLSLQADPDFKAVNIGLTDKNRSVQFIKVGQMIEKVKGLIKWSNQWVTTRDRKAEAFKVGSSKPLEEVKVSIALKESELQEIRDRLIVTEDDIWNMETKGEDVSVKQAEMKELQRQLDAKKEEIVIENERKEELAGIVQELANSSPDPELRQFYLEKVVYPILDSLKSIRSLGFRNTLNEEVIESSLFMKVTD